VSFFDNTPFSYRWYAKPIVTEQLMVFIPYMLQSSLPNEMPSIEVHNRFGPKPQSVSYSGPSVLPTAYLSRPA